METKRKKHEPVSYKMIAKEVTVSDESRKVSGYLAVFGVKDSDSDILVKGCFAKSIRERGPESSTNRKIAFLWQHDMKNPIGKMLVLREDDYGLYFEAEIDDVEIGERALKQLKSGTLNQFSIGFMYVWDKCEWSEEAEALVVREVNLFEGSVVTMGANEFTYFSGMKSEQKEDELRKETEAAIKGLPAENQYEIRQIISKNIALATAQPDRPLTPKEPQTTEKSLKSEDIQTIKFF